MGVGASARVRVLGQVVLEGADGPVPLEPRVRRLIARLLVDRNRFVSLESLIDCLWPDRPPRRPDKAVQDAVSAARQAFAVLGLAPIETRRDGRGYRLGLPPDVLDADLAVADVRAARAQCVEAPDSALASALRELTHLDAGEAFESFADEPWARFEIDTLEAHRADALAIVADLGPIRGERSVIDAIERHLHDHPDDPRLWAAWMDDLGRRGRATDALAVFQRARAHWAERGAAPPASLRDAERRALDLLGDGEDDASGPVAEPTGTAGLSAPAWPPARSPLSYAETDLVGRDDQLADLRRAWSVAGDGAGLALVVGEEGAGKTSLLAAFASELVADGGAVLAGRCEEAAPVAYLAVAQALRPATGRLAAAGAGAGAGRHVLDELARVLPELGPQPPLAEADGDRIRLFDAITGALRHLCAEAPVALLLDDVHLADPSTAALVRHLVDQPIARLLLVLAYRGDELERDAVLATSVLRARQRDGVVQVLVGPLQLHDVVRLVARHLPGEMSTTGLPSDILRASEGVSLFAVELLRAAGAADPDALAARGLGAVDAPETVRVVTHRRLGLLEASTRETLSVAAVIGRRFSVVTLAAVLEDRDRVLHDLEEARTAGLVADTETPAELSFRHGVYQEVLHGDLLAPRRADLHLRVARILEAHPTAARDAANHYLAAGLLGDPPAAARTAIRAAGDAAAQLDLDGARRLLADAAELVELAGDRFAAAQLTLERARVERMAGAVDACKHWARAAWEQARTIGDEALVVESALEHAMFGSTSLEADQGSLRLLEHSLHLVATPQARARLLARLVYHQAMWATERNGIDGRAEESLALARQAGDDRVEAQALWAGAVARLGGAHASEQLDRGRRLVQLGLRLADDRTLANGLRIEAMSSFELGLLDEFEDVVRECERVAERTRFWVYAADVARWRAMRALASGDWEAARAGIELQRVLTAGQSVYPVSVASMQACLHLSLGEHAAARELTQRVIASFPRIPALSALRALHGLLCVHLGDLDEATTELASLVHDGTVDCDRGRTQGATLALLAEVAVRLGDETRAKVLLGELSPYRGQLIVAGWGEACLGAADRYLGMLHDLLGLRDEASICFDDAVSLERGVGAPLVAMTERWRLLHRRRDGAPTAADLGAARRALADAARLGMATVVAELEPLLG